MGETDRVNGSYSIFVLNPRKGVSLGISWENIGGASKPPWGVVVWNVFLKQIASMLNDRKEVERPLQYLQVFLYCSRERKEYMV